MITECILRSKKQQLDTAALHCEHRRTWRLRRLRIEGPGLEKT